MELWPDATWRLSVTADWQFAELDTNERLVHLSVPSQPGPLSLDIPLVSQDAAALPQLGAEGPDEVRLGVSLQVTGATSTRDGLTLQVAARTLLPVSTSLGWVHESRVAQ
jgi:hypothetical protein